MLMLNKCSTLETKLETRTESLDFSPIHKAPLILAADTYSSRSSLALARGDELIATFGIDTEQKRSSHLLEEIDFLLSHAGRKITEVDIYSAIIGPGSFTGIRVGIASIRGLAESLSKPVIGATSLQMLASRSGPSPCTCSMVNAFRGEVFAQLFSVDQNSMPKAISEAIVTDVNSLLNFVITYQNENPESQDVIFCGDGALANNELIASKAKEVERPFSKAKLLTAYRHGWILDLNLSFLAADLAAYAYRKFTEGELSDSLLPLYIRPAEAEIKLKLGLIGKTPRVNP